MFPSNTRTDTECDTRTDSRTDIDTESDTRTGTDTDTRSDHGRPASRAEARPLNPFEVMSDPVRAYMVELLVTGAGTSGDLATMVYDQLGVGWSSTSRHLGILRRAGFVQYLADGPRRFYMMTDEWLEQLDAAIAYWHRAWLDGADTRCLGEAPTIYAARVRRGYIDPPEPPEVHGLPTRASRGRHGLNQSARGVGRSEYADDADGSGDLE